MDGKKARLIAEDMSHYLQEWVCERVAGCIPAEAEDETENCSSWAEACAKVAGRIQMVLKSEMAMA